MTPPSSASKARPLLKSIIPLIAAFLTVFLPTARAYVLEGESWPAGTVVALQIGLGSAGRTLLDGNTSWDNAAAPIAAMWSQQIRQAQVTYTVTSNTNASSGDQVNSVVFANNVFGQPFGGNTLAVTYYRYSGTTMHEADILLNRGKTFDSYRGPLRFPPQGGYAIADIQRVLLHELGHGIGLDHPDTAGQHVVAVMNSIINDQDVLATDDIAGGQAIYGAPVASTPAPTPGPGSPSHFANISTRMRVGLGEDVLIGGLIVQGSQPKKVILRAIGPSLSGSVANALGDPVLELHGASGLIATNDDWQSSSQVSEITASGLAPSNPYESAVIATLDPGSYTAIVSGYQNTQGVGLVDAYELDANGTRMMNISTRGQVGVSDDALIGGLIVEGSNAKRAIIRAIGPSLPFAGALVNPALELHDGSGTLIASNDDWMNGSQSAEIVASGVPPSDNRESALIATCSAGSYTAIVRGVNNATGVALLEVYDLDQ